MVLYDDDSWLAVGYAGRCCSSHPHLVILDTFRSHIGQLFRSKYQQHPGAFQENKPSNWCWPAGQNCCQPTGQRPLSCNWSTDKRGGHSDRLTSVANTTMHGHSRPINLMHILTRHARRPPLLCCLVCMLQHQHKKSFRFTKENYIRVSWPDFWHFLLFLSLRVL